MNRIVVADTDFDVVLKFFQPSNFRPFHHCYYNVMYNGIVVLQGDDIRTDNQAEALDVIRDKLREHVIRPSLGPESRYVVFSSPCGHRVLGLGTKTQLLWPVDFTLKQVIDGMNAALGIKI
jgi:hypothetical protein